MGTSTRSFQAVMLSSVFLQWPNAALCFQDGQSRMQDSCLSVCLSRNIQILREPQIQPHAAAAPSLARLHGTWHEVSRCSGEQERNQQAGRQPDKTNIDTT
ncbi:hypothetical protein V8C40DRAFT_253137 [Trichoderma camerunense]